MRVLITIGQQLPFDRLIEGVDQLAVDYPDVEWIAQIGAGAYQPQHMKALTNVDQAAFDTLLSTSDMLICHAGIGTIMGALTLGRPVLVMARDAERGEHRNQHQQATLERLKDLPGVHPLGQVEDLAAVFSQVIAQLSDTQTQAGQGGGQGFDIGGADPRLLAVVRTFIRGDDGSPVETSGTVETVETSGTVETVGTPGAAP
ncbi:MAG: glycosyltransferase [Pseudomonadota bacterium]